VPEVLEPGQTGFIVTELADAVEAASRVSELSRARCREIFETRFTAEQMAHDYVRIYQRIMSARERNRAA
jgi:glycosyltransferase involved in cell wall biosynthesis